jgi:hypothetical protein
MAINIKIIKKIIIINYFIIFKVSFILSGLKGETESIELASKERKLFRREAVDTFIFSTSRFLN